MALWAVHMLSMTTKRGCGKVLTGGSAEYLHQQEGHAKLWAE